MLNRIIFCLGIFFFAWPFLGWGQAIKGVRLPILFSEFTIVSEPLKIPSFLTPTAKESPGEIFLEMERGGFTLEDLYLVRILETPFLSRHQQGFLKEFLPLELRERLREFQPQGKGPKTFHSRTKEFSLQKFLDFPFSQTSPEAQSSFYGVLVGLESLLLQSAGIDKHALPLINQFLVRAKKFVATVEPQENVEPSLSISPSPRSAFLRRKIEAIQRLVQLRLFTSSEVYRTYGPAMLFAELLKHPSVYTSQGRFTSEGSGMVFVLFAQAGDSSFSKSLFHRLSRMLDKNETRDVLVEGGKKRGPWKLVVESQEKNTEFYQTLPRDVLKLNELPEGPNNSFKWLSQLNKVLKKRGKKMVFFLWGDSETRFEDYSQFSEISFVFLVKTQTSISQINQTRELSHHWPIFVVADISETPNP